MHVLHAVRVDLPNKVRAPRLYSANCGVYRARDKPSAFMRNAYDVRRGSRPGVHGRHVRYDQALGSGLTEGGGDCYATRALRSGVS